MSDAAQWNVALSRQTDEARGDGGREAGEEGPADAAGRRRHGRHGRYGFLIRIVLLRVRERAAREVRPFLLPGQR